MAQRKKFPKNPLQFFESLISQEKSLTGIETNSTTLRTQNNTPTTQESLPGSLNIEDSLPSAPAHLYFYLAGDYRILLEGHKTINNSNVSGYGIHTQDYKWRKSQNYKVKIDYIDSQIRLFSKRKTEMAKEEVLRLTQEKEELMFQQKFVKKEPGLQESVKVPSFSKSAIDHISDVIAKEGLSKSLLFYSEKEAFKAAREAGQYPHHALMIFKIDPSTLQPDEKDPDRVKFNLEKQLIQVKAFKAKDEKVTDGIVIQLEEPHKNFLDDLIKETKQGLAPSASGPKHRKTRSG